MKAEIYNPWELYSRIEERCLLDETRGKRSFISRFKTAAVVLPRTIISLLLI